MASGGHARHMATFWRKTWLPQPDTPNFVSQVHEFERWLAGQLLEHRPFDQIVEALLAVPVSGTPFDSPPTSSHAAPTTFLASSEYKPELLAANSRGRFWE